MQHDRFWLVHTPAALKIFVVARDEQLAIETACAHFCERHWQAEEIEFEAEELVLPAGHISGVVYAVWEAQREQTDLDRRE
jgi:hypothetical protein